MKSKLALILAFLSLSALFLSTPKPALASCSIANWDENTRNLQFCAGEFTTKAQLRSTTANINCLSNSNSTTEILETLSQCRDVTNSSVSFSNTPDSNIGQDADGKFYTCYTVQGVNRAIGRLNVSFSGGTTCTTEKLLTAPKNWNPVTEGNPLAKGTNDPNGGGHEGGLYCNDKKSINTAIGCIPTTTEGFVGAILTIAISLGGGIALLLILYGTFVVTTSAGIPDKLNEGQETISVAVQGLVFIIMSIVLLNLIGIKILQIPGL